MRVMKSRWVFHFDCKGLRFGRPQKYEAQLTADHAFMNFRCILIVVAGLLFVLWSPQFLLSGSRAQSGPASTQIPSPSPSPTPKEQIPPDQRERTFDQIIKGALQVDFDCDGISNGVDNCPAVANPDQKDTDGNGIGDACQQQSKSTTPAVKNCNKSTPRSKKSTRRRATKRTPSKLTVKTPQLLTLDLPVASDKPHGKPYLEPLARQ